MDPVPNKLPELPIIEGQWQIGQACHEKKWIVGIHFLQVLDCSGFFQTFSNI